MTYGLSSKESALKEWGKPDRAIREQFKEKLAKRPEHPQVDADRVRGMEHACKIKLRAVGLRLVYVVEEDTSRLAVYAVGKRDEKEACRTAQKRTDVR